MDEETITHEVNNMDEAEDYCEMCGATYCMQTLGILGRIIYARCRCCGSEQRIKVLSSN